MTTLQRILETTRAGLPSIYARLPELERQAAGAAVPPDFQGALRRGFVALIAEVKRRSPSVGEIAADLDPVEHAQAYAAAGAAAISVLTDGPYFGGSIDDLRAVARGVALPVLRKDFILDEAQVVEARAAGASALLLIVRALSDERVRALVKVARRWGVEPLVEVHDEVELERALATDAQVIGVNSRNLDDFRIDVAGAWELIARVPADRVAVAESGMSDLVDVERAADAGADAVLIGTALSSARSPADLVSRLCGVSRRGR